MTSNLMSSSLSFIMVSLLQSDVLLWIFLVSSVDTSGLEFQVLKPAKTAFQGHIISLIEGSKFQILCTYKESHAVFASCKWKKGNVEKGQNLLSLQTLKRSDAGDYTCAFEEYSRTITLVVLYPPKNVDIMGPYTVLQNSQVQLTCIAESNPPSTYWWTTDPSANAPKISSGATYTIQHVDTTYSWFYCFVQNKMVPTFGDPVKQAPVSTLRHIAVQESANIRDLPTKYGAYVGSTIDISCSVGGNPTPVVWWTKDSDDSFYRQESRLTEWNVKKNFAGVYSCNARNVIRINGSEQTIHTRKNIDIQILAIPLNVWAVAATATGWFVAMVVVAGAVVLKWRNGGTLKPDNRPKNTPIELATVCMQRPPMETSDSRRLLPETILESRSRSTCECSHYLQAGRNGALDETQRKVVGASNSYSDFSGLYELL